jgi:hypothetical protein
VFQRAGLPPDLWYSAPVELNADFIPGLKANAREKVSK